MNTNNSEPCDDGNACTVDDTCAGGTCTGGGALDCDDGNPCTDDACDSVAGCQYANNTVSCDDGDACTLMDTCAAGVCVGGMAPNCDDGNPCTDDSCDSVLGCLNTDNTDPCSDGDACTTNDTCAGGSCVGGAALDCDDANPCTDDSCDAVLGCLNVDNTEDCGDGLFCNGSEVCDMGMCQPGSYPCGALLCDEATDTCVECLGDTDCDDADPCTDNTCNAGTCMTTDNTDPCDDGLDCTENDVCQAGVCAGDPIPGCGKCTTALDCDDANPCTDDSCPAGLCVYVFNSDPCDDGSVCTVDDACAAGTCVGGPPLDCDDADVCTDDSCDPIAGCLYADNTAPCDDGDACTTVDTCAGGTCTGGPAPDCDDGNPCTDDACDPVLGCVHTANNDPCDDGNACTTNDTCSAGMCVGGAAPDCDDGNLCTDDSCDPVMGCVSVNNADPCDDGNACTIDDTCSSGMCVGGGPADCDDGNPCTDDSCDPVDGCESTANTAPCEDGNACTTNDICSAGMCVGGAAPNCDDANPCTDDSCDPIDGCINADNIDPCDDGDACTTDDTCAAGSCAGGPPPDCDDGNPCTDDTCDPVLGCVNTNNTDPCDDGNACTTGDTCSLGVCVGGAAPDCDDGNPCTDDSCDSVLGCVNANNTDSCDDGDACTTGDTCAAGTCVGGVPPDCDDGNVCTDDSCDSVLGCVYANNTASCEDGLFCNGAEICSGGTCQPGTDPCSPLGCDEVGDSCIDPPSVTGVDIFYAGRFADAADPSRHAMGQGASATAANVTNNMQGITGIRVRFDRLVDFVGSPEAAFDFAWSTGTGTTFSAVTNLATNMTMSAADAGGFTEVTIVFADDYIVRRWLRITVDAAQVSSQGVSLDGEVAGNPVAMPSGDGTPGGNVVLYVANMPGDVDGDRRTLLTDAGLVRENVNPFLPVPITNVYDVDKDGRVLLTDAGLTRAAVNPFFAIPLITP